METKKRKWNDAGRLRARITPAEHQVIDNAVRVLDTKQITFIRLVLVGMAQAVVDGKVSEYTQTLAKSLEVHHE